MFWVVCDADHRYDMRVCVCVKNSLLIGCNTILQKKLFFFHSHTQTKKDKQRGGGKTTNFFVQTVS